MALRRFLSFRDFDWSLLCLVLLLCVISVLEIYSTTVHTSFASFESKQIFWIAAGVVLHVHLRQDRLSPAARLGSLDVRRLSCCAGRRLASLGHKALGARRWISARPHPVPAFGVGQAGSDSGGGPLLCQPGRPQPDLEGDFQGLRAGRHSHAAGADSSRTWGPRLPIRRS